MQADTTTKFASGKIDNPDVLGGPDYGLVRTGADSGGLAALRNSILITLNLSKSIAVGDESDYLGKINGGLVAIEFGSPAGVPDGGSTLILLGSSLTALGLLAGRLKVVGNV